MFKDFVRAHMDLMAHHYFEKFHNHKSADSKDGKTDAKKGKPSSKKDDAMAWSEAEKELRDGIQVLKDIAERMLGDLAPFRTSLQSQSEDYTKTFENEELDIIWWMLVARGMSWQMSVRVQQPYHTGVVPPDTYDSDMKVWIE